jgi:hypothetical protein
MSSSTYPRQRRIDRQPSHQRAKPYGLALLGKRMSLPSRSDISRPLYVMVATTLVNPRFRP